jgi:hypothetical protein
MEELRNLDLEEVEENEKGFSHFDRFDRNPDDRRNCIGPLAEHF